MTSFFEHQRTSYKRNYLRNLILLASMDGILNGEERGLIVRIGIKRGLKAWQIEELLNDQDRQELFLPESINNRMNMLYDVMQIVFADNTVDTREMEFIANLVHAFELNPEIIKKLTTLFEHGTPVADEWSLFVGSITNDVSSSAQQAA